MRQTFDPEAGYLDEGNLREASLSADWGAKKPRRIRDESGEAFLESEDWQRYLWTIDPGYEVAILQDVKEVDRVTRRVSHEDGETNIWVSIPAHLFVDLDRDQAQDVFRLLTRDTYVWGMARFGWPEPPPVPGGLPPHASCIPLEVRGVTAAEAGRRVVAEIVWDARAPRRHVALNELVATDPAWQSYLQQVNPAEDHLFVLQVVDEVDPQPHQLYVEPDPDTGEPLTTVEVQVWAEVLRGGAPERDALVALSAAYAWAALQLGWPPPPS